jgi:hypothetical protein
MILCGVKDPGRVKRDHGITEQRETSIERSGLHLKSLSTTSVDVMVEHPPEQTKQDQVAEDAGPYMRMEVELGSDTSRDRRLAEVETANNVAMQVPQLPEASQEPTQPVPQVNPPAKREEDIKIMMEEPQIYLRYCPLCMVDQQLRAKHCNYCHVCVATYDHHCQWLGNCVGEKNRLCFVLFLAVQNMELAVCLVHGGARSGKFGVEWGVLGVIGVAGLLLSLLLVAHLFMLFRNLTTWELLAKSKITYLKNWPKRWESPFNRGLWGNLQLYLSALSKSAPFLKWQLPESLALP